MDQDRLAAMLKSVQGGDCSVEEAVAALRDLPYQDIGHTKIDHHRSLRNNFPEVIYAAGKSPEQVAEIFAAMVDRNDVLATRVSAEMASFVRGRITGLHYNSLAQTLSYRREQRCRVGKVAIVTAGTSDLHIAEEARETCSILGLSSEIIADVGVAGIHRLFAKLHQLRDATVVIVIAGMEGALASVVGGLVDRPIIAVPTSVGYGASFSGVAALLGMLTSCASGITVVNIDNGFGAACAAHKIVSLLESSDIQE